MLKSIRFESSLNFNSQIDSGQIISAKQEPSLNNFLNFNLNYNGGKKKYVLVSIWSPKSDIGNEMSLLCVCIFKSFILVSII